MFDYAITAFGKYTKHSFYDEAGNGFSVVPDFGASLLDLSFKGTSVLDSYDTPDTLAENKWSKGIFLFPYPNRLRDGQYTHLGEKYQFELTNESTGNSIHGFGKDAPMRVTSIKVTKNRAYINCRWQYDGKRVAYPFPFVINIGFEYTVGKSSGLKISMSLKNLAKVAIPVGLGWHPYFKITEEIGQTQLQMPAGSHRIEIDERMLPTGKKEAYHTFDTLKPIDDVRLDTGFYLSDPKRTTNDTGKTKISVAETIIKTPPTGKDKKSKMSLIFRQETGAGKFNFLQIFMPPTGKSIAIEPMTCNIDAFNNKDGLVLLSPRAVLDGNFSVIY